MRLLFLFILLWPFSCFAIGNCSTLLNGFNFWEQEIRGQVKQKVSLFPVHEWNPDSEFEGVALTEAATNLRNIQLDFEFKSSDGKIKVARSFQNLAANPQLPKMMVISDFKPREVLRFDKPGIFIIRLNNLGKPLCQESHAYTLGD